VTAGVVACGEAQLPTEIIKLYTPEAATVALGTLAFCVLAVKPLGPVQAYVAPATKFEIRLMVLPAHTVEGKAFTLGVPGAEATVTVDVTTCGAAQEPILTTKLYTPLAAAVADAMEGFCKAEEKLFGPVQA